jgi:putative Holliday junction resolvase
MRLLGLDVGERRIGVALSDPLGILASGLLTIQRRGEAQDLAAILELVSRHEVQGVVVGLPRRLDGSLGEQAHRVEAFAQRLAEVLPVPLEFWDERLSTVAAGRRLAESGRRGAARKARIDAAAAAYILQGYLDSRREKR